MGIYEAADTDYVYDQDQSGINTTSIAIASARVAPAVPTLTCVGFQAPFDVTLSLKSKTQRAIPLIMQLKDSSGNIVSGLTIPGGVAPVVNVTYSGVAGTGVDDTSLLDPVGQATSGNTFAYDPTTQTWQYNLASSAFTASGMYTVTVSPGDATQYAISPSCGGTFVRQ